MGVIRQVRTENKAVNTAVRSNRKLLAKAGVNSRHGRGPAGNDPRIGKTGSAVFTSRIRAIGNSKGVIINNQLMEAAGISADVDIIMYANEGKIILMEAAKRSVNTNLSTWDQQFKSAIKKGAVPEQDLFKGLNNEFDAKEW